MKVVMIAAGLLFLTGCATVPADAPAQTAETIRYETGPCFGACPVYAVTVSSDGTGSFEGKRFTAVTGAQSFSVTPAQFAAFRKRLAPYRPADGERRVVSGEAECGSTITDQPSASVSWTGGGAPASLSIYYGCTAPSLAALKQAVRAAPEALPIAVYVGKH